MLGIGTDVRRWYLFGFFFCFERTFSVGIHKSESIKVVLFNKNPNYSISIKTKA